MSDDDRDNDIESDNIEDFNEYLCEVLEAKGIRPSELGKKELDFFEEKVFVADKRAHHNALERKRRDHIKDSFHSLREALPSMTGEKVSRAQILKRAADYIQQMRRKNNAHQQDIEDLKRQNKILEDQIRNLEKAKATGNYAAAGMIDVSHYSTKESAISAFDGGSESESSDTEGSKDGQRKKLKTSPNDVPLRA